MNDFEADLVVRTDLKSELCTFGIGMAILNPTGEPAENAIRKASGLPVGRKPPIDSKLVGRLVSSFHWSRVMR